MSLIHACLAAVLLAGAQEALAKQPNLVRHEDQYWTWYAPKGWVAAQGRAGIDISSPTGVLHVGYGFSGTPYPVTNDDVRQYLSQNGGLDLHPLKNVVFTRLGTPFSYAGGLREVDNFRAFRTDRHQRTRGILTTDVWNDYYAATYGFAASVINAPKKQFRAKRRLLKRILGALYYRPQSP